MKREKDPRELILHSMGDISGYEIANNEVLVATYRRPEKTSGGIVLTRSNLEEDLYQSKAGLIVKMGPTCDFPTMQIKLHDWVVIRPSDGWALEVNFVHCRLVMDKYVRARIKDPAMVW
jgi:co-chaperonin GroES (HSP10)